MTDIDALVARLEGTLTSPHYRDGVLMREAAAAIRALAGEIERLKELHQTSMREDSKCYDELFAERDDLRAQVAALSAQLAPSGEVQP